MENSNEALKHLEKRKRIAKEEAQGVRNKPPSHMSETTEMNVPEKKGNEEKKKGKGKGK